ncbi:unnamed protein product [Pieris brassicae]|uniref:Reverse transcriptase RNase H-like domain-containing protein n=1 Tax=Pieris brassicae TaxID=7116 RepID=A0A9P0XHE3_PIEBR|nr:unnamed protein product [Pieris brassicae]
MFEGREIIIFTDHKPLTFAYTKTNTNSESPRRTRQLLYISKFTTDIRHVSGSQNAAADALSRVEAITCPSPIDYNLLAQAQERDSDTIKALSLQSNLCFKKITYSYFISANLPLIYDTSVDLKMQPQMHYHVSKQSPVHRQSTTIYLQKLKNATAIPLKHSVYRATYVSRKSTCPSQTSNYTAKLQPHSYVRTYQKNTDVPHSTQYITLATLVSRLREN